MTIDTTQIPSDSKPSAGMHQALVRRLATLRPDLTDDDRTHLAGALNASGACVITGDGEIAVHTKHTSKVRELCPELLGEAPATPTLPKYEREATGDAERIRRAKEREAHELARPGSRFGRDPQPAPPPKRIDMKAIDAKIAKACEEDVSLARSPGRRSMMREELLRAAGVRPFSDEVR